MEFTDVVRRRRMVRDYDPDRPLPDGLLDRLVDVALRAPSAGFTQGVSFLILEAEADRTAFWTATTDAGEPDSWLRGMQNARGLILVLASADAYRDRYALPDKGWTSRGAEPQATQGNENDDEKWTAPYWFVDAGMAGMALLYAVVDADPAIGACFFGVPADRVGSVRQTFGVPDEQFVVGVVSVGFRAAGERPSGSPRRRGRRPRSALVHRARWSDPG